MAFASMAQIAGLTQALGSAGRGLQEAGLGEASEDLRSDLKNKSAIENQKKLVSMIVDVLRFGTQLFGH